MSEETKQIPETFKTLVGFKVGMTQFFDDAGHVVPCTVVQAGPCRVTGVRTMDRDGYQGVQLGFSEVAEKKLSKPELGVLKKAGLPALRHLKEFRVASIDGFAVGQTVTVAAFKVGDYVDVQGTSKGHGFAGGVKRHHFRGGPATHGQSDRHRAPGSLTARRSLGRVLPGKRMAGHMGHETVTIQKMEVVKVEPEANLVYIKGGVPGPARSLVVIHETVKTKKHKVVHATKAGGGKKDKSFAAKAAKASAKKA